MHKLHHRTSWPLFDIASTRHLEQQAATTLPAYELMRRAGQATAQLALALAPHAKCVWIACGPGNNGGDGLETAVQLQLQGKNPVVTWLGSERSVPIDAQQALLRARAAGVQFSEATPDSLGPTDLCIDALLGIGGARPLEGRMADCARQLNNSAAPTLAIDVPSGLDADTGCCTSHENSSEIDHVEAQHTLSLLTLKPGLFTGGGRDACGQVWFDDLGVVGSSSGACAMLQGQTSRAARAHASHKGCFGSVAVIGGAPGMRGAAVLAASAALHGGAGRVYVSLLEPDTGESVLSAQPELMFHDWQLLMPERLCLVVGCGGGELIRLVLPSVLAHPQPVVLDADALNAIAQDSGLQTLLLARGRRGRCTVLTPHPLEAARLAQCGTADVQRQRLRITQELARRWRCVVVLKGSGSVIASGDGGLVINPTGNAQLATAGSGDVLAGMIGAALATGAAPFAASCAAVFQHGQLADGWPMHVSLTAAALAQAVTPVV